MRAVTIVLLLMLISPSLGATISNTFSAQGTGGIIRDSSMSWDSGVDNDSVGGNSASMLLTPIGDFQYQTKEFQDGTTGNFYNQTGYTRTFSGGAYSESLNVESSNPKQSVVVSHYGVLPSSEATIAKVIDESDLDMGQQVAWEGAGMMFRDLSLDVEATRETDGKVYHYRTTATDHAGIDTNMSGSVIARPEFSFRSFSDAFIFNDTALAQTVANNTTTDIESAAMQAM